MGHLLPYAPNYDGAGNLQVVNGYSGTVYNAENQWIQQTHFGITYVYDGLGRRVEATGGSSGTRVYWYDESGNVLSESDQNGVFQNDYIYFNGQKITWVDLGHGQPTTNNYYLTDHLGNNRMIITQVGTVCYDADFYPWGAEQYVKTNTCPQNYKFTGKERDPDMGEDYFGARFYKGDMSRFFSPDWSSGPEPVPYAKLDTPKTLNLYTYVGNNPTTLRDPDGHFFINAWSAAAQAGVRIDQQMADTQAKAQPAPNQTLSRASEKAIQKSNLTAQQAVEFEKAVLAAGKANNIDPNILVGLAAKESSLDPEQTNGDAKGLFQLTPGRQEQIGLSDEDAGDISKTVGAVAVDIANTMTKFPGANSLDLSIASWTLGVTGTKKALKSNGIEGVRNMLLDSHHPEYGRLGADYIDPIRSYQSP